MKNLEQIRAAHALAYWNEPAHRNANEGAEGGEVVAKLPGLILGSGLLATLAFAKHKGGGHEALMTEVTRHLANEHVHAMPAPVGYRPGERADTFDPHIRTLCESTSLILQRATAEALAYIGYLKRFAPDDQ